MKSIVVATLIIAGCSGGGDTPDAEPEGVNLSGWWSVDSYKSGDCGQTMDDPLKPAEYLYITPHLGIPGYNLDHCPSMVEADCTGEVFFPYSELIDNGWAADGYLASDFGGGCILEFEYGTAILSAAGTEIEIIQNRYRQENAQGPCTGQAAQDMGTSMPCVYEVRYNLTLVP